jgi:hypothetical protein
MVAVAGSRAPSRSTSSMAMSTTSSAGSKPRVCVVAATVTPAGRSEPMLICTRAPAVSVVSPLAVRTRSIAVIPAGAPGSCATATPAAVGNGSQLRATNPCAVYEADLEIWTVAWAGAITRAAPESRPSSPKVTISGSLSP